MAKPKENKRVAVLDDQNRLVGSKMVALHAEGIDYGDLPTNGTMKWDAEKQAFFALGTNFGKLKTRQPHSNEYVLARLIEALAKVDGFVMPLEVEEWLAWYDGPIRKRDEELAARPR